MKKLFILIGLLLLFANLQSQTTDPNNGLKYYMTPEELSRKHLIGRGFVETDPPVGLVTNIAEFSNNDGVLIRYPFGIPMALIKEIAKDAKLLTIVSNSSQQASVSSQYQANGVNMDNCSFVIAYTDSYWTRDYGPMYISYGNKKIGIVDFPYNRPRPYDDEIAKKIAEHQNIEWFGMNVIHTGGNYMTDGYNTSSSTTLVYEENPSQTQAQVDLKVKQYLGVNQHLVVEDPNGTYIDHIDCWGKFLAPDKIIIRKVPSSHPRYSAIEATAQYYSQTKNEYGKKYQVFRVNNPNDEPYSNSLIIKNKVLVPLQGNVNDALAIASYQEAMPGYQIIGFIGNPQTPWESTDALHCRTHELADLGQLNITHTPLFDTIQQTGNFDIFAGISAFSGANIYFDSTYLIYKVNSGEYDTIQMEKNLGSNYKASIPPQMEGSVISYYIRTSDASGRISYHPYIGKEDPHKFVVKNSSPADFLVLPNIIEFNTFDEAINGKNTYVTNYSNQNVQINNINWHGNNFNWWIDSTLYNLPLTLSPGDSVTINVKLDLNSPMVSVFKDSLLIESAVKEHIVTIITNPELFNSTSFDKNTISNVYPNPCKNELFIDYYSSISKLINLEILNLNGQIISKNTVRCNTGLNTITYNLKNLSGNKIQPGIYVYRIIDDGKVISGKFIVL